MRVPSGFRLPLFLALFLALLIPQHAASQLRIAVLPFTEGGEAAGTELGSRVAGLITLELEQAEGVAPVPQDLVIRAMSGVGLQPGDPLDRGPAVEVAREVGADRVILGSVGGREGQVHIQGFVLGVDSDLMKPLDRVSGPLGDVVLLAGSFGRLIPRALSLGRLPSGEVPFIDFEREYQLTYRQMWGEDGSHGYRILHEDPELGWKLGVRCFTRTGSGAHPCYRVVFRLSDDLHQNPDWGRDGYVDIRFSSEVPVTAERFAEVKLQSLDRTLSFTVDLIWVDMERGIQAAGSTNVPQGARTVQVRIRLRG